MSDSSASSVLLALSTGFAGLIRDVAPSVVSIQSGRARLTGFSWRPGLIVAAENALPEDGEVSIVAQREQHVIADRTGKITIEIAGWITEQVNLIAFESEKFTDDIRVEESHVNVDLPGGRYR